MLVKHRDKWLFLSRAVATTSLGQSAAPGTSTDVRNAIDSMPGLIEEMVCLDLFVCNNDRNPGNFLCDDDKQLWLIDFGNALLYRPRTAVGINPGIPRLRAVEENLSALFDLPYPFLELCHSWEGMDKGCKRIASIPDYFIESTVSRLPLTVLGVAEREFLIDFLIRRKGLMESIIRQNAALFSNLTIPPSA
jgi:hypothetical protein